MSIVFVDISKAFHVILIITNISLSGTLLFFRMVHGNEIVFQSFENFISNIHGDKFSSIIVEIGPPFHVKASLTIHQRTHPLEMYCLPSMRMPAPNSPKCLNLISESLGHVIQIQVNYQYFLISETAHANHLMPNEKIKARRNVLSPRIPHQTAIPCFLRSC